jgi:signal transduction histidine kinase
LSRLVTQLLETVRIQADRLELDRTNTNVTNLIQDVVEHMRPRTGSHNVVLHAPQDVHADIDPLRFEQVVTNLLDNAIKFSPGGEPIQVAVEPSAHGGVRVTVRDHGIGVPPEHRAHLFERFFQAHSTDHRSGMGLGLYITRQIVELHGGHIEVEFPPDGGTRFVVEIPAETAKVPTVETP